MNGCDATAYAALPPRTVHVCVKLKYSTFTILVKLFERDSNTVNMPIQSVWHFLPIYCSRVEIRVDGA